MFVPFDRSVDFGFDKNSRCTTVPGHDGLEEHHDLKLEGIHGAICKTTVLLESRFQRSVYMLSSISAADVGDILVGLGLIIAANSRRMKLSI